MAIKSCVIILELNEVHYLQQLHRNDTFHERFGESHRFNTMTLTPYDIMISQLSDM